MSTIVIVHGAWGGGWEWSPVADILRGDGHRVFTPTLAGMGERAHLDPMQPISLLTHITDLVSLLDFEQLRDVVLCAASYGGVPATGAADQAADRVRLLIYVDGLVPADGESALDLLPDGFASAVRAGLATNGPKWRVPMPPALFDALVPPRSVPAAVRQSYLERLRDHPALAFWLAGIVGPREVAPNLNCVSGLGSPVAGVVKARARRVDLHVLAEGVTRVEA